MGMGQLLPLQTVNLEIFISRFRYGAGSVGQNFMKKLLILHSLFFLIKIIYFLKCNE